MATIADYFKQAQKTIQECVGQQYQYSRTPAFSIDIKLTPARAASNSEGNDVVILDSDARDFIAVTDDLVNNGDNFLPKQGDIITEISDKTYTYEVSYPDDQNQPYRFTDTYRTAIRIHTTLKSAV